MRTTGIILALIGALALVVGCGDDSTPKPTIKLDTGVPQPDTGGQYDTGGQFDTGGTKFDTGAKLDMGGPMTNSGAICNASKACPSTSETCGKLSATATNGMCLSKCNASGTDCPVADSTTQLSKCGLIKDTASQDLYCGWVCLEGSKSYKCPNDTDYACQSLGAGATTSICVPK